MEKRNVFSIILKLIKLIGPFISVLLLAVLMGTVGFILAMNITIFASLAVVKFMGMSISLSYEIIFIIIIVSGILRGILRYFEQYSNHPLKHNWH